MVPLFTPSTEENGDDIATALETNTTLTTLDLKWNDNIDPITVTKIKELLSGREAPEVYDIPRLKVAVTPIPRGVKRKSSDLYLLLL